MRFSNRRIWVFLGIALAAIVLLTLFVAPANNSLSQGSTYSRSPDGYGAWYAYMQEKNVPVIRWQKSFVELSETQSQNITLLRVNVGLNSRGLNSVEKAWVEKGNRLVILGVRMPVTEAKFSSLLKSDVGGVRIETSRRLKNVDLQEKRSLLEDQFGNAVWKTTMGKGQIIAAVTPHLAANAYQDEKGNFEFLAKLVSQDKAKIFVDEFLHGYRDKAEVKKATENIFSYLVKTPIFAAICQGFVVVAILFVAELRRFGKAENLVVPVVENSEAYIRATAGVLEKANVTDFVIEMVGKEEQLQLQKTLGLGSQLLPVDALVAVWVSSTGKPASELNFLIEMNRKKRKLSKVQLKNWLEKWQKVRENVS